MASRPTIKRMINVEWSGLLDYYLYGGAEKDGHEIAGHENDGPSCRT